MSRQKRYLYTTHSLATALALLLASTTCRPPAAAVATTRCALAAATPPLGRALLFHLGACRPAALAVLLVVRARCPADGGVNIGIRPYGYPRPR